MVRDRSTVRLMMSLLMVLVVFGVYIFGFRVLVLLCLNNLLAFGIEYAFQKKRRQMVSMEVFITATIFTLILPPRIPLDISAMGIVFAVFFGKCVYGGTGYNVFNPAMVGRVFIHASFTKEMTVKWTQPFTEGVGGYGAFIGKSVSSISQATPMLSFRWSGEEPDLIRLLLGFTGGCIGETSAALIILIGLILLYKKIISKEIVTSIFLTYILVSVIASGIFGSDVMSPLYGIFSGGLMFGGLLMATDPVTSPSTPMAKMIYGSVIGLVTFVLRHHSLYTGGVMYAVLIGNMLSPIIDIGVRRFNSSQYEAAQGGIDNV